MHAHVIRMYLLYILLSALCIIRCCCAPMPSVRRLRWSLHGERRACIRGLCCIYTYPFPCFVMLRLLSAANRHRRSPCGPSSISSAAPRQYPTSLLSSFRAGAVWACSTPAWRCTAWSTPLAATITMPAVCLRRGHASRPATSSFGRPLWCAAPVGWGRSTCYVVSCVAHTVHRSSINAAQNTVV